MTASPAARFSPSRSRPLPPPRRSASTAGRSRRSTSRPSRGRRPRRSWRDDAPSRAPPRGADRNSKGSIAVANTPLPAQLPGDGDGPARGLARNAVVLLVDLELAGSRRFSSRGGEALAFDAEGNGSHGRGGAAGAGLRGRDPEGRNRRTSVAAPGDLATFVRFPGRASRGLSLTETRGRRPGFSTRSRFLSTSRTSCTPLCVGDRKVAEGERHGVRLHPGRENAIELPMRERTPTASAARRRARPRPPAGSSTGRLVRRRR